MTDTLLHHRHDVFLPDVVAVGGRCVVITLRDPAERLRTAFTFDLLWGGTRGRSAFHLYSPARGLSSPADFVRGANASSRARTKCVTGACSTSQFVKRILAGSRGPDKLFTYAHLREQHTAHNASVRSFGAAECRGDTPSSPPPPPRVATPMTARRPLNAKAAARDQVGYGPPPQVMCRGSPFLIPQADYLLGLELHPELELHVVCTRQFEADWDRLVNASGLGPGDMHAVRSNDWRVNNRTRAAAHTLNNQTWFFPDAAREYVRQCLYPQDTRLVQMLC